MWKNIVQRDLHFLLFAFVVVLLEKETNFGSADYSACVAYIKIIIHLSVVIVVNIYLNFGE